MNEDTKNCAGCGPKDRALFSRDSRSKDGLQPRCKDCNRAYRAANIERIRAYDRDRNSGSRRDYVKDYNRTYYQQNRGAHASRCAVYHTTYYLMNKDAILGYGRRWRLGNKERMRNHTRRRRHLKANAPDTLTSEQWGLTVLTFEGRCAYCGKDTPQPQEDHVTPLARGGGRVLGNIVPACAGCNIAKWTHDYRSWMLRRGLDVLAFEHKLSSLQSQS